jgi:hypothetical protein
MLQFKLFFILYFTKLINNDGVCLLLKKIRSKLHSSNLQNKCMHTLHMAFMTCSLKVPKCEILMSWILMIFLS